MKDSIWKRGSRPLIVMLLVLTAVLLAYRGIPLAVRPAMLAYLGGGAEDAQAEASGDADTLIAFDPSVEAEANCAEAVSGTLSQMRIAWRQATLDESLLQSLDDAEVLLICSQDLSPIAALSGELIAWVENGGRLGLMMSPRSDGAFEVLSHKLGVTEYSGNYQAFTSLQFVSGVLPLWDFSQVYDADGAILDYAMPVRLENDCTIYLQTGGESPIALMWSREVGRGRVLVNNNSLIQHKDSRGFALTAYLALRDTVVYPIINAGMIYIDDFPAPQPTGTDEALLAQFGYSIQGFFRNHWWPDMKTLALQDGLRYTGVLIETYNDRVNPPFTPDTKNDSLIRYYMSELLQSGGEVGLHGYNHMPLCPDGFEYDDEDYVTWPDTGSMAAALTELQRYASKFLPNAEYKTYVPPSNYLSDEGKATLLATLPNIRTVSGVYYPETGKNSLVQEFCEEADGSVSVPRITSGFLFNQYNRLRLAQEMLLHGVFSHFIHPDDVLDAERGADEGWDEMFSTFSGVIGEIEECFPALRWSTASEGAAAVQRYARLTMDTQDTDNGLSITLSPFFDEVWLAMKTPKLVGSVENGAAFRIADGFYWIRADGPQISIVWGDGV